jgi:hypothetical protein
MRTANRKNSSIQTSRCSWRPRPAGMCAAGVQCIPISQLVRAGAWTGCRERALLLATVRVVSDADGQIMASSSEHDMLSCRRARGHAPTSPVRLRMCVGLRSALRVPSRKSADSDPQATSDDMSGLIESWSRRGQDGRPCMGSTDGSSGSAGVRAWGL